MDSLNAAATTGMASDTTDVTAGTTLLSILQQRAGMTPSQPQMQPQAQSQPTPALLAAFMTSMSQGSGHQSFPHPQLSFTPSIGAHISPQSYSVTGQSSPAASDPTQLLAMLQQLTQHSALPAATFPSSQPQNQTRTLDKLAGASPDDERILVNTLSAREHKGWNVRQALEALHGVNNHTSGSWKDYFLDNFDRLSRRVSLNDREDEEQIPLPKQETFATSGGRMSMEANSASTSQTPKTHAHRRSPYRAKGATRRDQSRGRSPTRAHSQHRVRFSDRPSKSPTPPPAAPPDARIGRKFTDVEEEYLMRSVKWQLSKDPYASYAQLARVLGERAHECGRTVESWRTLLMQRRRADVERLIADARDKYKGPRERGAIAAHSREEEEEEEEEESDGDAADVPWRTGREPSRGQRRQGDRASSPNNDDPDTEDDVRCMGAAGQAMTTADFRVAARYIASRADWDAVPSNTARWSAFSLQHPQRTKKAWATGYVNHRSVIDSLVPKYREQYAQRKGDSATRSSGSVAATRACLPPFSETSKRRHGHVDPDDEEPSVSEKRSRGT